MHISTLLATSMETVSINYSCPWSEALAWTPGWIRQGLIKEVDSLPSSLTSPSALILQSPKFNWKICFQELSGDLSHLRLPLIAMCQQHLEKWAMNQNHQPFCLDDSFIFTHQLFNGVAISLPTQNGKLHCPKSVRDFFSQSEHFQRKTICLVNKHMVQHPRCKSTPT